MGPSPLLEIKDLAVMLSRRLEDTLISGTVIEEKYLKESQHG